MVNDPGTYFYKPLDERVYGWFEFCRSGKDLSSPLRNGTPKSSRFSDHLFTESLQTESFEIGKKCNVPTGKFSLWFRPDVRYYAERLRGWGEEGRHPGENLSTEQSKNPTALQFSWA
jgi:hypothetical protein